MTTDIKIDLPKFTGTKSDTHDIYQWIKQLQIAAVSSGWTHPQVITNATLSVRGPALDFCETLSDEVLSNWDLFQASLLERFGLQVHELLDELMMMRQGPQEDVSSFCDAFIKLTSRIEVLGEPVNDHMKRRRFIEALVRPLKAAVTLHRPMTFADAIEAAKYFERQNMEEIMAFLPEQHAQQRFSPQNDNRNFPQYNDSRTSQGYQKGPFDRGQRSYNDRNRNPKFMNRGAPANSYSNQLANNRPPQGQSNKPRPQQNNDPTVEDLSRQLRDMQIKFAQWTNESQVNACEIIENDYDYGCGYDHNYDYYDNQYHQAYPQEDFEVYADVEMTDVDHSSHRPR